jgi:hypothetical protein
MVRFKVNLTCLLISCSIILIVLANCCQIDFNESRYKKYQEGYYNLWEFKNGKAEKLRFLLNISDSLYDMPSKAFKASINNNDVKVAMGYIENKVRILPNKKFEGPSLVKDHKLGDSMGYCEGRLYRINDERGRIMYWNNGKNGFDSIGIAAYYYIFEGPKGVKKGTRGNFVYYFDMGTDTLILSASGYIEEDYD